MNKGPYFSIIVPVYNVEAYLGSAIDSLLKQTFSDMEILLIDDCSTDASKEICIGAAADDGKIRLICHEVNKGLYQTRKTGIENAEGKYIVFLDGDDSLDADALRCIHSELIRQPDEIIQFGLEIVDTSGDALAASALQPVYEPFHGELSGDRLVDDCFTANKFCWSMAGKAFESSLMKKAYGHMSEDARMNMCEDIYQTFVILHFARGYRGVPDKNIYKYYYGRGMSAESSGGREVFERIREEKNVIDAITAFISESGTAEKYAEAFKAVRRYIEYTIVNGWMKLSDDDRAAELQNMTDMLDKEKMAMAFARIADEAIEGASQAHGYRVALTEMRESEAYKIGLRVTALPRAVKKAVSGEKSKE